MEGRSLKPSKVEKVRKIYDDMLGLQAEKYNILRKYQQLEVNKSLFGMNLRNLEKRLTSFLHKDCGFRDTFNMYC